MWTCSPPATTTYYLAFIFGFPRQQQRRWMLFAASGSSTLRIPSSPSDSQGGSQTVAGEGRTHPSCPLLARQTLVCGPCISFSGCSLADSRQSDRIARRQRSSSRTPVLSYNRLEVERLRLINSNVSPAAIPIILAARRPTTVRIYDSTWKAFLRWCSKHHLDASSVSVVQIVDFLQEGFASGLSPNTLHRQVAALSSVLAFGPETSLSKEPLIRAFLRGATNLRPPVVHRFPTWDLNKVLTSLTKPPFEPLRDVNLKFLSFKVSFLVAITSTRHISELTSLSIRSDFCVFHKDRVVLRLEPAFIPKVNSTFHRAQELILPDFCPSPRHHLEKVWHTLDVHRALKIYISCTSSFRRSEALFISFQPSSMGSRVTATMVGHWLRATISTAYES
ncbi:uncharacterized protein LOC132711324 [Pantherophis guttatus]|uniref:Uncharacterized protein LOC132711324 n=1 Tax=Pantherophis guttatus TaxID=94885 RepID=A0ABM3ZC99_PANGU|nr:uncharacterized protein LOC132711324 [Pantherophis guttatus]